MRKAKTDDYVQTGVEARPPKRSMHRVHVGAATRPSKRTMHDYSIEVEPPENVRTVRVRVPRKPINIITLPMGDPPISETMQSTGMP